MTNLVTNNVNGHEFYWVLLSRQIIWIVINWYWWKILAMNHSTGKLLS